MGDLPGTIDLAQPDRQAKARRPVLGELLLRAAAQQGGRECDRVAGGHVELGDLKSAVPLLLPIEERWPCLSIGASPAHSDGRRDVEHDHIVSMMRDAADIPGAHRGGPVLDQRRMAMASSVDPVMKPLLWVAGFDEVG